VSGDAGIGKTRLLHEFSASAAPDVLVVTGQCADSGVGPLPQAAIIGVVSALVESVGVEAVREASGSAADALGLLVPAVGEPRAGTGADRLHAAVAEAVRGIARTRPVVVVIEDLHWADGATLSMVRQLASAISDVPVLLVLSYRSDDVGRLHPARSLVAELERSRTAQPVVLGRLSEDEVAELARSLADREIEVAELEPILERSGGVPFYVEELVGSLGSGLPGSLRELLLLRYERLSPPTQRVLRVIAAGGVTVPHDVVTAVFQGSEHELEEAVREARDARLLSADEAAYSFRHALLQEAVHAELLPGERTRFHTRYAEVLERVAPSVPVLAEVADHWWLARVPDRALASAVAAAEAATEVWASPSAMALGERALDLWDQVPDAREIAGIDHAALLARTAVAAHFSGRLPRAFELVREALAEWPADDRAGRAEVLARASFIADDAGAPERLQFVEEALGLLEEGERDDVRAELLIENQRISMHAGRFEDAVALGVLAREAALASGSRRLESNALNVAGVCRVMLGDLEGLEQLERAGELAADEPQALLRYFINASNANLMAFRFERALELTEAGRRVVDELGIGYVLRSYIEGNQIDALSSLGRWDGLLAWSERLAATGDASVPNTSFEERTLFFLVWQGQLDRAEAHRRANAAKFERYGPFEQQLELPVAADIGELELERGEPRAALDVVSVVLAPGHRSAPFFDLRLVAVAARAIQALRERGEQIDDSPYRGVLADASGWHTFEFWNSLVLAELGEGPWSAVIDAYGPAWYRPYARWRWGAELLESGDRVAAQQQLRLAVAEAEAMGVGLVVLRAGSLLRDAGLAEAASRDDVLTAREQQVLELIAAGMSNGQIAARLYISTKTVSVHVSAILRKLGAASRTEAVYRARERAEAADAAG
jgi:DNA-binding CsgD family transcriptional regulator